MDQAECEWLYIRNSPNARELTKHVARRSGNDECQTEGVLEFVHFMRLVFPRHPPPITVATLLQKHQLPLLSPFYSSPQMGLPDFADDVRGLLKRVEHFSGLLAPLSNVRRFLHERLDLLRFVKLSHQLALQIVFDEVDEEVHDGFRNGVLK